MKGKIAEKRARGQNDQGDEVWALVAKCECGESTVLSKFENRCGGCGNWIDKFGNEFVKNSG